MKRQRRPRATLKTEIIFARVTLEVRRLLRSLSERTQQSEASLLSEAIRILALRHADGDTGPRP